MVRAKSLDLCLEAAISLIFKGIDIMRIFWEGSLFTSQSLFTRVTPHPMLRHTKPSGSVGDGKAAGSKVIEVVT